MYIRQPIKCYFASISIALLALTGISAATAQPTNPPNTQTVTNDNGNTTSSKEPFADWGLPTPPGAENYQVNERNTEHSESLGEPTDTNEDLGDGWQQQSFEKGAIYTKNEFPASQASIQGEIWEKWQTMGAQNSALGYPISSEITVPKGKGKYNVFEGGVLYSHPEHGTHAVIGTILEDWTKNGFENGKLGSPIQDATITEEGLVYKQEFENETATGYAKVIQDIVNETPGANGHLPAQQVWEDGKEFAQQENISLADAFSTALNEVREHNSNQEENFKNEQQVKEDSKDPAYPKNKGDIFYSEAATFRYQHGHNGIFVGNPNASDFTRNDTVEASGVIEIGSKAGADDPKAGVKRRANFGENDTRPDGTKPRLINPQLFTVNTDQNIRDEAAIWAIRKTAPGYDEPGAKYNYNFAFNRKDGGEYNCSQLVWLAFLYASGGEIDLDSNKGMGVYPTDIRDSEFIEPYTPKPKPKDTP